MRYRPRFQFGRLYPPWPWMVLLILAGTVILRLQLGATPQPEAVVDPETVRVLRAVDGDTLLLDDGRRIRLLGVDTPETKHPDRPPEPWGQEASEFTSQCVDGQFVRLEYDRERLDSYGRWLAYAYLNEQLLNELIIRHGYSRAEIAFPFRSDMKRRFLAAEELARTEQKGIWSRFPPAMPTETDQSFPR